MLTITLSEEVLQTAIQDVLNKMLTNPDSYNNPLKKLVEAAVGTSYSKGTLTEQIQAKVVSKIEQFMETSEFDALLGKAVATAIADREVNKKK